MRLFWVLWVLFTLSACLGKKEGTPWTLEQGVIVTISGRVPACGILYTLVEVKLRTDDKRNQTIFLPCVEVIKEPLPEVGSYCSANGEFEIVDGETANGSLSSSRPLRVARKLTCNGTNYTFDL